MCCYWFSWEKCIAYISIPQTITPLLCWSFQVVLWNLLLNFIRKDFEGRSEYSKLIGRASNPKFFIITWYYRSEKNISLELSHLVQCRINVIIKDLCRNI